MILKNSLLIRAISICSFSTYANTPENNTVEKNNSILNKREALSAETQARGTVENVEVTQKLRERIMADDQLSAISKILKLLRLAKLSHFQALC